MIYLNETHIIISEFIWVSYTSKKKLANDQCGCSTQNNLSLIYHTLQMIAKDLKTYEDYDMDL